jgi:alpha-mannosidase
VRQAAELNAPLVAMQEAHHEGSLTGWGSSSDPPYPPEKSFLSLTSKNVIVTAIKMSEDPWLPSELVVRLQEAAGRAAEGELSLGFALVSAEETNLTEEPVGNRLKTEGRKVYFNIRPREIKTLKLALRQSGW